MVAVTKADVGEPELAAEEVAELVPDAEIVRCRRFGGTGLDELLAALDRAAAGLSGRAWPTAPRRAFTSTARSPCAASGRW